MIPAGDRLPVQRLRMKRFNIRMAGPTPHLRGRLFVRFRIDPSGKVQRAEAVEGDFRDPAFVNSVLEKIRRWDFEPTGGRSVDVLYPFVFIAPS